MIVDGYDYISESDFSVDWLARAKPSGDLFNLDEIAAFPVELVRAVLEAESHSPGIHRVNALG
jgi:hypothetical protein